MGHTLFPPQRHFFFSAMSPPLPLMNLALCDRLPATPPQRSTSSSSRTPRPVVGIPATGAAEEVVDGCVVEDPRTRGAAVLGYGMFFFFFFFFNCALTSAGVFKRLAPF